MVSYRCSKVFYIRFASERAMPNSTCPWANPSPYENVNGALGQMATIVVSCEGLICMCFWNCSFRSPLCHRPAAGGTETERMHAQVTQFPS